MGGEQRGVDFQGQGFAYPASHPQQLEFGIKVKSVTRLDLDAGHALGHQDTSPVERKREQLVLACLARRRNGREDAAASLCDLLVTGTVEAQRELLRAATGKHEVGVAVDQGGRDQRAGGVDDLEGVGERWQVG